MAKAGNRFQYQPRSAETLKQRANARGGDFDSMFKQEVKLFKPREGKNIVRILPPTWEDANHFGYDIWVNYGIGVDDQSYLSLSKMKNEPDPLAEARKLAERSGDKITADALNPKKRVCIWVIDRMAEDEGPQLWSAPWTIDKDFANLSFDEDTNEILMIDEPNEGRDVRFYKEGTGLTTKYDASKMRLMKPSALHEDEKVMDEWLAYIQNHPIPDCLNFYDYDHITNVFDGHVGGKDKDEKKAPGKIQTTSGGSARNGITPAVTKVVEEVDEDGVVTEAEDEEVETEAQSIRERLAARKRPPVEDDEPPRRPIRR